MPDDELDEWCMRWLTKDIKAEDLAEMLRHEADLMDCRARAEQEMRDG